MFAFILAGAIQASFPDPQSPQGFPEALEKARTLSAQLDDPSSVGMLVLMKLRRETENVCPLGTDEMDVWIKRNRLTEVESYVMGSLCESYWSGRQAAYEELKKSMELKR